MPIELYEVFDAPTEVLLQEHKSVQLALPNSHGAEHSRLQALRDTIQQELQERKSSHSLLKELLPIIEGSNPDTWLQNAPVLLSAASNAPASLQDELRELVAAGQRIASLRNAALQPAATQPAGNSPTDQPPATVLYPKDAPGSQPVPADTHEVAAPSSLQGAAIKQTAASDAVQTDLGQGGVQGQALSNQSEQRPAQEPLHEVQGPGPPDSQNHEQQAEAGDAGGGLAGNLLPESSAASSQTSSTVAQQAKGPPMTAHEAALAAFREEQRKLSKARKALLGGGTSNKFAPAPSAPAATRTAPTHQAGQEQSHHHSTRAAAAPDKPHAGTTIEASSGKAGRQSGRHNEAQDGGVTSPHRNRKSHAQKAKAAADTAPTGTSSLSTALASVAPTVQGRLEDQGQRDVNASASLDQTVPADLPAPSTADDDDLTAVSWPPRAATPQGQCQLAGSTMHAHAQAPSTQAPEESVAQELLDTGPVNTSTNQSRPSSSHLHVITPSHADAGDQMEGTTSEHPASVPSSPSAASTYDYESDTVPTPYPDQTPPASVRASRSQVFAGSAGGGAADMSKVTSDGNTVKVPPGQLPTDRWTDWELELGSGGAWGVSAWGREAQEDPVAVHLRALKAIPKLGQQQAPGLPIEQPGPVASKKSSGLSGPAASAGGAVSLGGAVAAKSGAGMASRQAPSMPNSEASSPVRRAPPLQPPPPAAQPSQAIVAAVADPVQVVQGVSVVVDPAPEPAQGVVFARQGTVTRLLMPALPGAPAQQESAASIHASASVPAPATDTSSEPARPAPAPGPEMSSSAPKRPDSAGGNRSNSAGYREAMQCVGSVYASYFNVFQEILYICSTPVNPSLEAGPNQSRAPSRQLAIYSAVELNDKYQSLMLRLGAWIDALTRRDVSASAPKPSGASHISRPTSELCARSSKPSSDGQWVRFFAIADDTLHPEVRQVVELALAGLPGWASDPIDQITEVGKPDPYPEDYMQPADRATPDAATAATRGVYVQARSPLHGRCNMWNILWSWSLKVRAPLSDLLTWQRVNHFPEAKQLTRKDLLARHVGRYQIMHGSNARLGPLFGCLPTTFTLPKDATAFQNAFSRASHGVEPSVTQPNGLNLWIVKPVGLSRGRGIRLIRSLREVFDGPYSSGSADEPQVVQRYVTNPVTIQGCKFDLRLYVLVTSFNPLEAWLCSEGFARFASQPFSLEPEKLNNRLMHLTNSSVQKAAAAAGTLPAFLQNAQPYGGSKCSLSRLRQLLAEQGVPWSAIWARITDVLTACLFAAQDSIPACQNAFELFGADVLIDTHGAVWVLEINSSPSLSMDTPLDRELKPRIIRDAIGIVDPLPFDRDALLEVLAARSTTKSRASRRPGMTSYMSGTAQEERQLMCADLQQVLGGHLPRRYGEQPQALKQEGPDQNWFSCISPSPLVEKLAKLKKG